MPDSPVQEHEIIAMEPIRLTLAGVKYVIPPIGIRKHVRVWVLGNQLVAAEKRMQEAQAANDVEAAGQAAEELTSVSAAFAAMGAYEEGPNGERLELDPDYVADEMQAAVVNRLIAAIMEMLKASSPEGALGEAPTPAKRPARRQGSGGGSRSIS